MTDYNIDIDLETNLPQLPEDHYWQVTDKYVSIFQLVEPRWVDASDPGVNCYWASGRTRTRKNTSWDRKSYNDYNLWEQFLDYFDISPKPIQKVEEITEVEIKSRRYEMRVSIKVDFNWTPSNILELAFKCYEKWQANLEQERQLQEQLNVRKNLMGTYPPKRLDLSNED